MSDLVAPNRDDFVSIAVDLAQDAQRRMDFRANARSAYEGISLFDGKGFARDFAAILRSACRAK
jgi:predicted O-linked N-acetylglucosamine transferase (SPINDLY family)